MIWRYRIILSFVVDWTVWKLHIYWAKWGVPLMGPLVCLQEIGCMLLGVGSWTCSSYQPSHETVFLWQVWHHFGKTSFATNCVTHSSQARRFDKHVDDSFLGSFKSCRCFNGRTWLPEFLTSCGHATSLVNWEWRCFTLPGTASGWVSLACFAPSWLHAVVSVSVFFFFSGGWLIASVILS